MALADYKNESPAQGGEVEGGGRVNIVPPLPGKFQNTWIKNAIKPEIGGPS